MFGSTERLAIAFNAFVWVSLVILSMCSDGPQSCSFLLNHDEHGMFEQSVCRGCFFNITLNINTQEFECSRYFMKATLLESESTTV